MKGIYTLESLEELRTEKPGLLLYFSNDMCSVCKVLKPKVTDLLADPDSVIHRGPRVVSQFMVHPNRTTASESGNSADVGL